MRAAARRLSGQLRRSPRALAVLRWALGAAILGAVLASLSWEETARAFAGVVWPFVLANLAIKIALRVLAGIKWHLIVRLGDPGAPLRQSLAAHFAGTAVGAVAPVLGSDLTVAYAYYRQSQRASAAISTIFADRLIGMYLLIAIGAVAVLANLERMLELEPLLAFAAAATAAAVAAPLGALRLLRARRSALRRAVPRRVEGVLGQVVGQLRAYWAEGRGALLANAALSLLVQLLRVLSVWTLALAVGAPGSLLDYAVVAPLMFFLMVLPIPAVSIGLEQGVFFVMLGMLGVPGELAFAMAVLNRLLTIVSVLPGIGCISLGLGFAPRADVRLSIASKREVPAP